MRSWRKNTGETLQDTGVGSNFLAETLKAEVTKPKLTKKKEGVEEFHNLVHNKENDQYSEKTYKSDKYLQAIRAIIKICQRIKNSIK